jgi:Fic family protein
VQSIGAEVPIVWRGRRARAFVPARLADRDLTLDLQSVAGAARAQAAVEHGAETMPEDFAALARLLLRAEGVASSFIEGVTAPVVEIVLAEADEGREPSAASWVAANLAAVTEAIEDAHAGPLTIESLCRWHRTLMTGSPTPAQHVGVLRTDQGWIGGTSPLDAHLVTPPPERVPALVDDLVAYVNRDDLDPVSQAAIAHAQFEIIHPFADGNGRVGRVLVAWVLVRRLSLVTPPPVSARIAADVGGYSSGLVLSRTGDHNAWVRWFANAVSGAGRAQQELVASVERLQREWRERLAAPRHEARRLRSNAAAWQAVDLLPRHLVLTGPIVAGELAIPLKSANAALRDLVDAGVLVEHGTARPTGRGRPSRLYTSAELLGLAGSSPLRANDDVEPLSGGRGTGGGGPPARDHDRVFE